MEEIKPINNNIEIFELRGSCLEVTGHIVCDTDFSIYYKTDDKQLRIIETYTRCDLNYGEENNSVIKGYTLLLDVKDISSLEFYLYRDAEYQVLTNNTYKFSKISKIKYHYYHKGNTLIKHADKRTRFTVINGPSRAALIAHELRFLKHLCFKKKRTDIAFVRIMYRLSRLINKKEIWLFSDREFMGRDSGEILFRYSLKQPESNGKKLIFVVDRNYDDYKRISEYGKVCSYHSLKFKLLLLKASFLISSHADNYVFNPFGKDRRFVADLLQFDYVYLTHGILLHDSSKWLNRINKNFSLNVVTSPLEYDSILNGDYYLDEGRLIKTGIPRYDAYLNSSTEESKRILFMPSWREAIAGEKIKGTQRREYNEDFITSEYYIFYRSLFNDERLLNFLRSTGYEIHFCIHPSFRSQLKDFKMLENDVVHFKIDVNTQEETLRSRLLVTDYSSAACDFAYLSKPVIYANFDMDHIDAIHYYERGYFDYEKDGFGPDCRTAEEVINSIIDYISSDCTVEEKYRKRAETFFYYRDNKNSKRVYDEILKLEDKRKRDET